MQEEGPLQFNAHKKDRKKETSTQFILRDEIFLMQFKMADFKYSTFVAKLSQKVDKMSKLFFDVVTSRLQKFQMVALKTDDGTLSTDPDEM